MIVVCALCHCCCCHLFITAGAIAAVTIVNAATIATAIAAAITAIVAVTNAFVNVIAADDNDNGSIATLLGWLWVEA
jgi:hypothetical protein